MKLSLIVFIVSLLLSFLRLYGLHFTLFYSFYCFAYSVKQTVNGKFNQNDRSIKPGAKKCRVGSGKLLLFKTLWTDNLGSWFTRGQLIAVISIMKSSSSFILFH